MAPAPKKAVDESTYAGRFAARLRQLREKAGLSVEQLAESMTTAGYSVSAQGIYAWERGRNQPPLNAYPVLSAALGLKRVRDVFPAA